MPIQETRMTLTMSLEEMLMELIINGRDQEKTRTLTLTTP
jgi:hypothetical protein